MLMAPWLRRKRCTVAPSTRLSRILGLGWEWSISLYGILLRVTGGKERIRQFIRLTSCRHDISDRELAELHRFKTARYAQLMASGACSLRPGVAEAIRAATVRGQRLAIATTTSRHNVKRFFQRRWAKTEQGCSTPLSQVTKLIRRSLRPMFF